MLKNRKFDRLLIINKTSPVIMHISPQFTVVHCSVDHMIVNLGWTAGGGEGTDCWGSEHANGPVIRRLCLADDQNSKHDSMEPGNSIQDSLVCMLPMVLTM